MNSSGCGQAVLPESLASSWSSPAASHHRRWQPVLPEGDRGTEAGAETGAAMPLSNLPVFKQCCGTGPSRDQAPSECQPAISIIRRSVANDSRLRDSAHDPERSSEMVDEGECTWTDSVHPRNSRIEKLSHRHRTLVWFGRPDRFCNTTVLCAWGGQWHTASPCVLATVGTCFQNTCSHCGEHRG